ncbi:MAG: hypothetical protein SH850_06795 [Planctomycetaceae bacterium]|nr:hypothetical protein [Planctomycetaceae bacterium]
MLASSTTLGCGLSIYLAFWTTDPQAADIPAPQVYRFQGWTMVIQPGPVAAKPVAPLQSSATTTTSAIDLPPSPTIRLASLSTQLDQPPMPPLPATMTVDVASQTVASSQPVVAVGDRVRAYSDVYDAIPFSRAEYDANPSYRHDAAMEFLFGQMRPTVIHRGHTTVTVQQPDNGGDDWSPWVYYGRSGWYAPYPAPGYRVYRGW